VEQGYASVQVIAQALKADKAQMGKPLIYALTHTRFQTPRGTAYIRADHTMMSPETVWECQGDAKAKIGYACPQFNVLPTNEVAPPVAKH
jgi:hypothetical protein